NRTSLVTTSWGPWRNIPVPIAVAGDFAPSSHNNLASWQLPRLPPRARKYVALREVNQELSASWSCQCGIRCLVSRSAARSDAASLASKELTAEHARAPAATARLE